MFKKTYLKFNSQLFFLTTKKRFKSKICFGVSNSYSLTYLLQTNGLRQKN